MRRGAAAHEARVVGGRPRTEMVTEAGEAERKGIHDILRLAGIMVADDVRPLVVESKLQANRAQLDAGRVGARAELWSLVCERYTDENHEVCGGETVARGFDVAFQKRTPSG